MIYHLLPEVESFSEQDGGALSRWTANILRHDDAQILCPSADPTWGFASTRVHPHTGMRLYGKFLKKREFRLRNALRIPIVKWLMRGFFSQLTVEDVLYVHNRPEYVLALPSERCFQVVLHMHNDHLRNLSVKESALLRPDLTVFNSHFLEEQGRSIVSGLVKSAVLYNGADENCFHPPAEPFRPAIPIVLFVGRLIREKGVHVLVEAMRILQTQGVRIQAKILGSVHFGDDRTSAYADDLRRRCPGNTVFRSYMSGEALAEHFRTSTIFCCPSVWEEPFGMVNVEAMASGLPVVASRVGGIPEIFAQGGGLLVPKDDPAALASALKLLVEDETERRRLAAQAITIFQNRFRWSVIRNEYEVLMQSLQTGKRSSASVTETISRASVYSSALHGPSYRERPTESG